MQDILKEIISDLANNFRSEEDKVLTQVLEDVITDALNMSNRAENDNNLKILKSNIKKAVKTIYLQRGTEDVISSSQSGLNNVYDKAMDTMLNDIIKQNKRVLK